MRYVILFLLTILFPASASANCEVNFAEAEKNYAIPKGYLSAISRTEVGVGQTGKLRSWALNVAGDAIYFRDKYAAAQYLAVLDIQNIDIGCMQINKNWHGERFLSKSHMLDPYQNVMYAAYLLRRHYNETRSWERSIKFYHSRNPQFHNKYYEKFKMNIGQ